MDAIEIKNKIDEILDKFGMSGKKAAEVMGISHGSFRNRMNQAPGQKFNMNNYMELVNYIKVEAEKLQSI